jgi:hypothetical protein
MSAGTGREWQAREPQRRLGPRDMIARLSDHAFGSKAMPREAYKAPLDDRGRVDPGNLEGLVRSRRPAAWGDRGRSHLLMRASMTAFWNSVFMAFEMPWVGLTSK